jgi:hypothetical protein
LRAPEELLELREEPPDDLLPAEERELPPDERLPTDERELPPEERLRPAEDLELPPEDRGLLTEPERGAEYRRLRLLPTEPRELEDGLRRLELPDGADGRL